MLLNLLPSLYTAASVSTNIGGNIACPGEELMLTCTGQGTTQRWRVENQVGTEEILFSSGEDPNTQLLSNLYNFTLRSSVHSNFESTLSVIATNNLNNTFVECTDRLSQDTVTIKIAGLIITISS